MTQQRRTTVARVTTRTLLIAGFAGGAWLLGSSAAHAADASGRPAMTDRAAANLAAPVTGTTVRLLAQVLAPTDTVPTGTAATPTGGPHVHAHHTAPSASAPAPAGWTVLVEPRSQPVPAVRNRADAGTGTAGLLRVVAPVTHLLRPVLGPAGLGADPVTGVFTALTGDLRTALAPVTGVFDVGSGPVVQDLGTAAAAGRVLPVAGGAPVQSIQAHHTASARSSTVAAASAVRATGPSTVVSGTRQVPVLPEPAPLPAFPGSDVNGVPTTASGSHQDGGALVTVPVPVTGGQQADPRGPCATQVAVRLLLAEAPTFSPD